MNSTIDVNTVPDLVDNNDDVLRLFGQQKPWQVSLLIFLTFSFYTIPWFYRHASNLRKLAGKSYSPWLWLFVPIFAIAVPFALNRLFEGYKEVTTAKQLRWDESATLSGVLAFLMLATGRWVDQFDGPLSLAVAAIIVLAIIFLRLTAKLNRFYDQIDSRNYRTPPYKVTLPSWLIFIILGPIVLLLYGFGMQQDWYRYMQPTLPRGQIFEVPGLPLTLRTTDRWSIVKSGTKSDGSAELELVGAFGDSFVLIFKHVNNDGFDPVMEHRRDLIFQAQPDAQCEEQRKMDSGSLMRRAALSCRVEAGLESIAWELAIVETEFHLYEFFGVTSAPKNQFKKPEAALEKLVAGFRYNPSKDR